MRLSIDGIFTGCLSFAVALVCAISTAEAQNRFSPAILVGDEVITQYELDQRTSFLSLLNAPGDPETLAQEQLVNAAIQRAAAQSIGVGLNQEAVEASQVEFAARANLTLEQFLTILEQNGIGPETFRDFVGGNILWADYVRTRFADEARDIPLPLVARTLTRTGTEGGTRVLYSEILLPTNSTETRNASLARAQELADIETEEDFAAAARLFSVSNSRASGGALGWRPLEALPEEIRNIVGGLSPGEISRPIELEDAIGLFLLRDSEVVPAGAPETFNVDYALFLTQGDAASAQGIIREIDQCDDLYGVAQGLPEDRLIREAVIFSELPADVRDAVPVMDVGDTAILNRTSGAAVLMLCGRTIDSKNSIDLDIVGTRVLNEKLTGMAAHHLSELQARTIVRDLRN